MKLTVQDIYNFPELNKMTLVAGRGGLANEVSHCGILDYEYDRDVSSKYYDYNFKMDGGFLTLTSFLYAKNDPNLIYDAVKKLVAKKGSGLIIKNIFRLPISENVIRYADRMNYPIFVLNDSYPFFEDIIVLIDRKKEQYESFYYREQKVNLLLHSDSTDGAMAAQLIYDIHPSMQDDLVAAYFQFRSADFSPAQYLQEESRLYQAGCIGPEDAIFYYRNGFLLIHSAHRHRSGDVRELLMPYVQALSGEAFAIGVSRLHHIREELRDAIQECIYAARFHETEGGECMTFDQLGVYQAILPYVKDSTMRSYQWAYISPLEEYDSERNGEILHTVVTFVKCGGDLEKAAEKLGQHRNTIRYRLKRAGDVLKLNPFDLGDYERLALAVRIWICCGEGDRNLSGDGNI